MDDLRLSPNQFAVDLVCNEVSEGFSIVRCRFGYPGDDFAELRAEDAQTIAAWFAALAVEIRKSDEVTDATA